MYILTRAAILNRLKHKIVFAGQTYAQIVNLINKLGTISDKVGKVFKIHAQPSV